MSTSALAANTAPVKPSQVSITKVNGTFKLLRNGVPYVVRGAGGDESKQVLRDIGGNSFRTWGSDNLDDQIAQAERLGLTVTVGIWLGHKEHGFNYHDPDQVRAQFEMAKRAVLRCKDSPALLAWGLGNEMESGQEDDPAVWKAVQDIAAMAHRLDPHHPTMTVIAEIGGNKVANINKYCPDVDIVGINTYAGASTIPKRYLAAGGTKPYIITEFGPPGTWELPKNKWGAVAEYSSTEKAEWYRTAYEKAIANQPLCLGAYAFSWGHKQEATATWFGLFLPDGNRLGAVDTLQQIWTGKAPKTPCPVIRSLKVDGPTEIGPGAKVKAALDTAEPDGSPTKVEWVLQYDPASYKTGGDLEASPPSYPEAIAGATSTGAEIRMPPYGGGYRLFAYVRDTHGGAAVANVPLFVTGNSGPPEQTTRRASLPLVIYGASPSEPTYVPTGYMGNTAAIKLDPNSTDSPRAGAHCLRVDYTAKDNWGGVVWQFPANDWGDAPGGFNITGAKSVSFWARGARGGEVVSFAAGLIDAEKHYPDTAKSKLPDVKLTTEWKRYSIDLTNHDLTRLISGFLWTLGGQGQPVTFYLDDIRIE